MSTATYRIGTTGTVFYYFWGDAARERAEAKAEKLNAERDEYFEAWNTLDLKEYISFADYVVAKL